MEEKAGGSRQEGENMEGGRGGGRERYIFVIRRVNTSPTKSSRGIHLPPFQIEVGGTKTQIGLRGHGQRIATDQVRVPSPMIGPYKLDSR